MPNQPDMSELLRLAQSPSGRQLLAYLQKSGGNALQDAIQKATAGDYASAKSTLSSLLSSPQAQKLLRDLEENR